MTTLLWIGVGLIALFIIGKIMMSVGKFFLWMLLVVGVLILAFEGARHMGWITL